jgi:hypothetical protein
VHQSRLLVHYSGIIPFAHIFREELQIRAPLVSNDFAARKTPNWDDLCGKESQAKLEERIKSGFTIVKVDEEGKLD